MTPLSRSRTRSSGDKAIDAQIHALLDEAQATHDRDLLFDILASGIRLARGPADRLDLKVASAALREMRAAFEAFAPYRTIPKVTIFGSARTHPDDPLYAQARQLAHEIAGRGWMVVTGAGPGIMAAGMEGAGRDRSFGVSIRLPFETSANGFIAGDDKLVSMKYFFTRKLMLMKESKGFVALPGGFGTLDETFELFTLQQTGKAVPAPTVLLDVPGGGFWQALDTFLADQVERLGLISPGDRSLALTTDDVARACDEIVGFYRNFHSLRWVGPRLVVRLNAAPTDHDLAALNQAFGHLCTPGGRIERTEPLPDERADGDSLEQPRIVLPFDIMQVSRLRTLIDGLNDLNRCGRAPRAGAQPSPPRGERG